MEPLVLFRCLKKPDKKVLEGLEALVVLEAAEYSRHLPKASSQEPPAWR